MASSVQCTLAKVWYVLKAAQFVTTAEYQTCAFSGCQTRKTKTCKPQHLKNPGVSHNPKPYNLQTLGLSASKPLAANSRPPTTQNPNLPNLAAPVSETQSPRNNERSSQSAPLSPQPHRKAEQLDCQICNSNVIKNANNLTPFPGLLLRNLVQYNIMWIYIYILYQIIWLWNYGTLN